MDLSQEEKLSCFWSRTKKGSNFIDELIVEKNKEKITIRDFRWAGIAQKIKKYGHFKKNNHETSKL